MQGQFVEVLTAKNVLFQLILKIKKNSYDMVYFLRGPTSAGRATVYVQGDAIHRVSVALRCK